MAQRRELTEAAPDLTQGQMDEAVNEVIAKAIQSVDWTFFNENYNRQAEEVVRALNRSGYAIVPRAPSKVMVDAGREAIEIGQHLPSAVAGVVFDAMVEAGSVLP
jgi:predicted CoA-binding protein